jgi:hypothetical protein
MKQALQIFTLSALLICSLNSSAKSPSGVYMTASDFMNKKLSYEKAKIHLNNSVLELSYLTVIDHEKKVKLNKRDVYGFVDANNKSYRFNNNSEYQIAEAGNITIYLQMEKVAQGKGYKVKKNY